MQAMKEARWWLEGKSSFWHVGFIVFIYVMCMAILYVSAVLSAPESIQFDCAQKYMGYCLSAPISDIISGELKNEYPALTAITNVGKSALIIFSTSILTISLLRDSGRIVLSENACVYEESALNSEKSTVKSPCLVFRMMNRGGQFIFDVKVSVALRFVGIDNDKNGKTFRFFPLAVLGPVGKEGIYPILEPNLPFRVYVRLDQSVQSAIYIGALSYAPKLAERSLAERLELIDRDSGVKHSGNTVESAMVVSITGKDSISGKEVVTSIEYGLSKIFPGKFADILLNHFQNENQKNRIAQFNKII